MSGKDDETKATAEENFLGSVVVKTESGQRQTYDYDESTTVGQLEQSLRSHLGVAANDKSAVFLGKTKLSGGDKVVDLGLKGSQMLLMVIKDSEGKSKMQSGFRNSGPKSSGAIRRKNKSFDKKQRGDPSLAYTGKQEKEESTSRLGMFTIGFLVFVVVGSSVFQMINTMLTGSS